LATVWGRQAAGTGDRPVSPFAEERFDCHTVSETKTRSAGRRRKEEGGSPAAYLWSLAAAAQVEGDAVGELSAEQRHSRQPTNATRRGTSAQCGGLMLAGDLSGLPFLHRGCAR